MLLFNGVPAESICICCHLVEMVVDLKVMVNFGYQLTRQDSSSVQYEV